MSEFTKASPRSESNSAAFGVNETRRMPLSAEPASSRPGLRPLRGSFPVGYVCACSAGTVARAIAHIQRTFPISRSSVVVSKVGEHLLHHCDFAVLPRLASIRKHRTVHLPRAA